MPGLDATKRLRERSLTRVQSSPPIPPDKRAAQQCAVYVAAINTVFPGEITDFAASLDPMLLEPFRRALWIALARYRPAEIAPPLINRIGRELRREFRSNNVTAVAKSSVR